MMENITIVKAQDNQHILALYNPDDVREYGITASRLLEQVTMFSALGANGIFIGHLMHNFIMPYFQQNTKDQYLDYKPVSVDFKQLPDDMVLLIVQFCKKDMTCDGNCRQCKYDPKEIVESSAEQYINEYLSEKQIELDEFKNQCVLKTDSLDTLLKACTALPIAKCIDGDIIKYQNAYYLSFTYYDKDWESIKLNVFALGEFGELKNPLMHSYLTEHGKLISDKLLDICNSDLVK